MNDIRESLIESHLFWLGLWATFSDIGCFLVLRSALRFCVCFGVSVSN